MGKIVSLMDAGEREYRRGSKAAYVGSYAEAVYHLRSAAESTGRPEYYIDLLSAYNSIAFYDNTVSCGGYVLQLKLSDVQRASVMFYMGEAYYCMGYSALSKEYLQSCVKLAPNTDMARDASLYISELAAEPQDAAQEGTETDETVRTGLEGGFKQAIAECRAKLRRRPDRRTAEILCRLLSETEQYKSCINTADKYLEKYPGSISLMCSGLDAAQRAGDAVHERRFSAVLRGIKDCDDNELNELTDFFSQGGNDPLAKDVFAALYKENTYDRLVMYALAAAYYNNGETAAAKSTYQRLEQLEGDLSLSSLALAQMELSAPPKRMLYTFAPTAEQIDLLCAGLYALLDNRGHDEAYAKRLNEYIALGYTYADNTHAVGFLRELPLDNPAVREGLKRLATDVNLDNDKKLILAQELEQFEKELYISIGPEIMPFSRAKQQFSAQIRLNRPRMLFSEGELAEATQALFADPGFSVIADAMEFALVMEVYLRAAGETPESFDKLCRIYEIPPERADALKPILLEKGLIDDETC